MPQARIRLQPFRPNQDTATFALTGLLERVGDTLSLAFELTGPIYRLRLPSVVAHPERRHGLWEDTCFEGFIGAQTESAYWEFNFSPAGHWNVYHFDGYRQGMHPEAAFDGLPMESLVLQDAMRLTIAIDLTKMNLDGRPIRLALSAVLVADTGVKSYWALAHGGDKPDFHHPAGFRLEF